MDSCSMLLSSSCVVPDYPVQSTADAVFSPEVPSPEAADAGSCPASNPMTHLGGRPGPACRVPYQKNPAGSSNSRLMDMELAILGGHTP